MQMNRSEINKKEFGTIRGRSDLERFFVKMQINLKETQKCECGCDQQKMRCGAQVRAK